MMMSALVVVVVVAAVEWKLVGNNERVKIVLCKKECVIVVVYALSSCKI